MLTLHEQIARKCIHFNGIMEKTCKAGVNYKDVRVEEETGPYKFPCLKQGGECPIAEFRTEEQVNQVVDEIEGCGMKAMAITALVKEHYAKTNEITGVLDCPCGGKLTYGVVTISGHIRANCNSCKISLIE